MGTMFLATLVVEDETQVSGRLLALQRADRALMRV